MSSFFSFETSGSFQVPLIAGPCSAETEEQLLHTAKGIAAKFPNAIFRAGIWKPRTRPGSFEGLGSVALPWLIEVKRQTGLKLAIEVANAKHVELALSAGIDALWIGARTVVNPFSVQEIADSLPGDSVPVLIKNPMFPDLDLWVGAIERIQKKGCSQIAAVHRGFHTQSPGEYRNRPCWDIPIRLMEIFPGIPMFCDPSHISGKPDLIFSVAQRALDLGMNGLMLEVHDNPSAALSDAFQQITPESLSVLLETLIIRNKTIDNQGSFYELEHARNEIDQLDEELVLLLARRMEISARIGEFKKRNNISILQIERWRQIVRRVVKIGEEKGLSPLFLRSVYQQIHERSIGIQSEILDKKVEPLRELPG